MPTASTAKKVTTTPRKRRTRKVTKTTSNPSSKLNTTTAKVVVEDVKPEVQVETPKVTPTAPTVVITKEPKSLNDLLQLRGIDFVILPLIYLETFVVNILQNLDVKVPERVTIK
tara:strand:+ start:811 stop:1152 length:342 start_codon:yes stop_codon:yes gene_type:complete